MEPTRARFDGFVACMGPTCRPWADRRGSSPAVIVTRVSGGSWARVCGCQHVGVSSEAGIGPGRLSTAPGSTISVHPMHTEARSARHLRDPQASATASLHASHAASIITRPSSSVVWVARRAASTCSRSTRSNRRPRLMRPPAHGQTRNRFAPAWPKQCGVVRPRPGATAARSAHSNIKFEAT